MAAYLQDETQAALLYYDDVSDASGNAAHALVYAGLLAAYELHGKPWIEHCYFYDRVKSLCVNTASCKGRRGAAYLSCRAMEQNAD